MKRFIGIVFFLLIMFSSSFAQTYGKLYSKIEADKLYGPVLSSVEISSDELQSLIAKTKNYMKFHLAEGRLSIFGDERQVLSSENPAAITEGTVLKVYSTSILRELLSKGQNKVTTVEQRSEVMSLTNGDYTLEMAVDCPPYCP